MVGTVVDTRRKLLDNRLKVRETCCLTLEHMNLTELSDDMVLPNVTFATACKEQPLDINAFEHFKIYKINSIRLQTMWTGRDTI